MQTRAETIITVWRDASKRVYRATNAYRRPPIRPIHPARAQDVASDTIRTSKRPPGRPRRCQRRPRASPYWRGRRRVPEWSTRACTLPPVSRFDTPHSHERTSSAKRATGCAGMRVRQAGTDSEGERRRVGTMGRATRECLWASSESIPPTGRAPGCASVPSGSLAAGRA